MKTKIVIITGLAISMTLNGVLINQIVRIGSNYNATLTECARQYNVFACKYEATPIEQPKIVYKDVTLLPPPAI
jgi:hypothetical protein